MIKNKPSSGGRRSIHAAGEGVDHTKRPIASRAGSKLIDNAESISSSGWSHAVEITGLVKSEPAPRTRACAAGEGMDHALGPDSTRVGELENHRATALTRATAAGHRGAIEIAFSVERNALVRFRSVGAAGEGIEHGMGPATTRRRELKNGARAGTTLDGRAIKIAGAVDH